MICQNCKMHEATSHFHSVVNGVVRDSYLCSKCASALNNKSFYKDDLFDLLSAFLLNEQNNNDNVIKCKKCGTTFENITKSGRVGCAECYKTFARQLEPALVRIHGKTSHIGKRLDAVDAQNNNDFTNSKNKIDILKEELKLAIANEEYEKAAIIRDKIKLENEG